MILKELLVQYEIQNNLSHAEVAEEVGVSLSTYYRWISGESTKLKKTTIQKLSKVLDCDIEEVIEETNRIKPILGNVKAGYDLWAEQDIEGYIELGQADAQKGDYFLRVVGDSMEGAHIYDGDLVYVQSCSTVESGRIAVVMIGDEATIKKVYFKNELMILEAANPKYESKFFTMQEVEEIPVKVIGLVRFVRTDFV
ncbi:helix-turn-helix domain-containing protein [Clostridium sp. C1]|uniref:LexA family protein n=1 Tax=Clostridium sp. C1 TaxID=1155388 RepID=UPI001BAD17C8|nr:S24 family peptidase [Clostridium sp. C1]QUN14413.1 helix-turn-helix domain-containing protein [Clostridium sp. C1]